MKEEYRQRTIRLKLASQQIPLRTSIPTGFPSLDRALGVGGLPRGRIIELFGPPSSGKTTLALQIAARLQRNGGTAAWIDAEHNFDPAYAAAFGLGPEGFPVIEPASAEQALEIARTLTLSGALDLLVIDSAAALVPELELETALGESGPGLQSRVLASGLRRISQAAAKTGTVLLFLNQIRTRLGTRIGTHGGPAGEDAETSAGGAPLKLHAAVRIVLNQETSRTVRFRVLKNKAAEAFAEGMLERDAAPGFVETP